MIHNKNANHKKVGVAVITSDTVDFGPRNGTFESKQDKEEHF